MQQHARGPAAGGVHHVHAPADDLDGVALGRYPAQLGGDQTGERLVRPLGVCRPTRASWSVRVAPSAENRARPSSSVPAGARSGVSCGSCSSRTSPTTSSTMSSSVATPAVPPYSSMITAIVRLPDSRSSSRSTVSDSGTRRGSRMISATGTRTRRSAGIASASLMCAVPTTASRPPRYTGKRDRPVARVAFATSSQVAVASRAMTWTRGVITFSAVRSARFSVRTNSSAVSASRAPSLAECRARAASSWGPRAAASSSVGSTPKRRTTRFAVLLRWLMKGRKAALNQRCALPTVLATVRGRRSPSSWARARRRPSGTPSTGPCPAPGRRSSTWCSTDRATPAARRSAWRSTARTACRPPGW